MHVDGESVERHAVSKGYFESSAHRSRKATLQSGCGCHRSYVGSPQRCGCPQGEFPRITPFPTTPPPKPTPTAAISALNPSPTLIPRFYSLEERLMCMCNGIDVEVKTKADCLSKPNECILWPGTQGASFERPAEHACACLGRKVGDRKRCCDCESRKCKCWSNWWKDRRYRRHRAFQNCNRICRRREC